MTTFGQCTSVRCFCAIETWRRDTTRGIGMRLELVGLDGATVYLQAEQVGATVGALRRWEAARAGLPSPSLLRLKSGGRNLSSDEAPLAEVHASVHAMLRLPGGTHNKYFFSGRMEEARQKPNGGNTTQAFAHPSDPAGPHMDDLLPVVNSVDHHGNPLFNLNPMLIETVRLSDFFWELATYSRRAQLVLGLGVGLQLANHSRRAQLEAEDPDPNPWP